MNTDTLASAFSSLPYFNSMMVINKSGTCAATKLIQCVGYGLDMNSVYSKFEQDPNQIDASGEMPEESFIARRDVFRGVEKWCDRKIGRDGLRWTPILYAYEIVNNSARKDQEWGHMVWTDATLSRFLVVMVFGPPTCRCGDPFHNDYAALTKLHAEKFMCLAKYIYHKQDGPRPEWVHATYATSAQPLSNAFLDKPTTASAGSEPPIFHITASDVTPSLTSSELNRIDALLARGGKEQPPRALREAVTRRKGRRETLADAGASGSYTRGMGKMATERQCNFCGEVREKLRNCARCKLVAYCDKTCQADAWKFHKNVCKQAAPIGQSTTTAAQLTPPELTPAIQPSQAAFSTPAAASPSPFSTGTVMGIVVGGVVLLGAILVVLLPTPTGYQRL